MKYFLSFFLSLLCVSMLSQSIYQENYGKMEKDLQDALVKGIRYKMPLLALREIIVSYKKNGGSQENASRILNNIRDNVKSDEKEDVVLELMDFVTGYCSPKMRVWD